MKIFDRFEDKVVNRTKDEVKTKVADVNWKKVYWATFGMVALVCVTRKPQQITIINNPSHT